MPDFHLAPPPLAAPYRVFVNDHLTGVVGPVGDYCADLTDAERQHMTRAVDKRRREFSTGRYFARIALRELGLAPASIAAHPSRRPVWPNGLRGSISHSNDIAIVVVATRAETSGIGVDIEHQHRVPEAIEHLIMTAQERAQLPRWTSLIEDPQTVIFSAKEAVFKAVNPQIGLMIDYNDVTIELDGTTQTFRAHYVGPDSANAIMERGAGVFGNYSGHVLTCFITEHDASPAR